MDEKDIKYSTNEEDFRFDELRDAVEDVFDDDGAKVGDIRVVYSGEAASQMASLYLPQNMLEAINEIAYDEAGEHAEDWPKAFPDQRDELMLLFKNTLDDWATKHNLHPLFGSIENVKKIKVRLTSLDGDYEVTDE